MSKRSLTLADFLKKFPDDPEAAQTAFERYRRASATPFDVIGTVSARSIGLMSPPPAFSPPPSDVQTSTQPPHRPTAVWRETDLSPQVSPVFPSGAGLDAPSISKTEDGFTTGDQ